MNIQECFITSVSPMSRPREDAAAVANGSKILIFGGRSEDDFILSSCEKYNELTNR